MMNISKGLFTLFTVVGLAACSGVQIEGSWIEPVPGMPEMVQGVTLENGGRATSINMATLQYESWEKNQQQQQYSICIQRRQSNSKLSDRVTCIFYQTKFFKISILVALLTQFT